eukprot:360622-Chlamydomonas_euryale.AAC.2
MGDVRPGGHMRNHHAAGFTSGLRRRWRSGRSTVRCEACTGPPCGLDHCTSRGRAHTCTRTRACPCSRTSTCTYTYWNVRRARHMPPHTHAPKQHTCPHAHTHALKCAPKPQTCPHAHTHSNAHPSTKHAPIHTHSNAHPSTKHAPIHTHSNAHPSNTHTPMHMYAHMRPCARTWPRSGSCSAGIGPKWSLGMVTMMRPLAALARPARFACSVVNASSGRFSLSMRLYSLAWPEALTGFLAKRIANVSAVLILRTRGCFPALGATLTEVFWATAAEVVWWGCFPVLWSTVAEVIRGLFLGFVWLVGSGDDALHVRWESLGGGRCTGKLLQRARGGC